MKSFLAHTYGKQAIVSASLVLFSLILLANSLITNSLTPDLLHQWSVMLLVLTLHSGGLLLAVGAVLRSEEEQPKSHKHIILALVWINLGALMLYPTLYFMV